MIEAQPARLISPNGSCLPWAAASAGQRLWEHGTVSRLLADASIAAQTAAQLTLIETQEAMEAYLRRAGSPHPPAPAG